MQSLEAAKVQIKRRKHKVNYKKYLPYFLMMLPGLIYLVINNYLPIAGVFIAFKDINFRLGIFQSPWVGFDNFKFLFSTGDAWVITRNTLYYNIVFIFLSNTIPIIIAIFLSVITSKRVLKAYQSVILLPHLISMVIVSYLVYAFLNGDVGYFNNTIFPALGLESKQWYANPKYWLFILPIVYIWKAAGYQCIVYLAAVIGINKEYYEAAELDGASTWQQITKITLPLIKPTIIILVMMGIGRIFYSDFGLFYQVTMNSGNLYPTTNVIETYVYRALMTLGDFGMSSAAGLYQSLVGFVLVIISNAIVRKLSPENSLF